MQRVLIVDDSKTAQLRLKKMLSRYELAVDVSFSAEEALGYLSYRSPAVIFMDHHMEGMDGFEALKIIKANPNTAMIPVIMYTAQKGDVYVGQARALGALDILSKEVIKPASLERVLSGLKIVPKEKQDTPTNPPAQPNPVVATASSSASSGSSAKYDAAPRATASSSTNQETESLEKIRLQVARLFEMHIADVRQQMADNARFIVRRLSGEIEKNGGKEPVVGDVPLSVLNAEIDADQRKTSVISSSLLLLILLGLSLIAYELFGTRQELLQMENHYQNLISANRQQQQLIKTLATSLGPQQSVTEAEPYNPGIMEALSWALDIDLQFDYASTPLNEQQILKVSNLVYRLASTGFSGNIDLMVHLGNFCLQPSEAGEWQLAESTMPVQECVFTSDIAQEYSASDFLSLPYLNFEQNAMPIRDGVVELNVSSQGYSKPRHEYPEQAPGTLAGAWNLAAAENNRVSINFNAF